MASRKANLGAGFNLPLPSSTRVRSPRYIEAAILYIHGDPETGARIEDLDELSRMVPGTVVQQLRDFRRIDQWDEFRLTMIAKAIDEKRAGGDMPLVGRKRTTDEIQAIREEEARQQAEIPQLQEEARKLLDGIKSTRPDDKSYGAMVVSLGRVTEMLDTRTGKAEYEAEITEGRRALLRATVAQKPRDREFGVDIVLDELPMADGGEQPE